MNKIGRLLIFSSFFILTSCMTQQTVKQDMTNIGTAAGIVVDFALLANGGWLFFGSGTALGEVTGEITGEILEDFLTPSEKEKIIKATSQALSKNEGTTVEWKSDENKGVHGSVTTSTTSKVQNSQPKITEPQKLCRNVTQIVNINGNESRKVQKLCQNSDGSWAV